MKLMAKVVDLFIHLGEHLHWAIPNYGVWTYLLLFLIIFCETGLVVTPILPGDSLLFATGTIAAHGSLSAIWLFIILCTAAVAGDTVNYWIGYLVGPMEFHKENGRFLNKGHLDRTQQFYEKYGGKTIVIARFISIIRTFAPFVAGIGMMTYGHFITYNISGGIAWVAGFVFAGFYFGNLPFVKDHFTLMIYLIIAISILSGVIELLRQRHRPDSKFAHVYHDR